MIRRFDRIVGLSDHTLDNTTAIASIALGASIVEKHFTLDRRSGGADSTFSINPVELRMLCDSVKIAWEAVGSVDYSLKPSEIGNIKFRRSLYFVRPLSAGDVISPDDIRSVRPGYGLPPKFLDAVIGSVLKCSVDTNTPVVSDVLVNPPVNENSN